MTTPEPTTQAAEPTVTLTRTQLRELLYTAMDWEILVREDAPVAADLILLQAGLLAPEEANDVALELYQELALDALFAA